MNKRMLWVIPALLLVLGGSALLSAKPKDLQGSSGTVKQPIRTRAILAPNAKSYQNLEWSIERESVVLYGDGVPEYAASSPSYKTPNSAFLITQTPVGVVSELFLSLDDMNTNGWSVKSIAVRTYTTRLGQSPQSKHWVLVFTHKDVDVKINSFDPGTVTALTEVAGSLE